MAKIPMSNAVDSRVGSHWSLQGRRRTFWVVILEWDPDHVFMQSTQGALLRSSCCQACRRLVAWSSCAKIWELLTGRERDKISPR